MFTKLEYEQRRWEFDINSYYRYKDWAGSTTMESVREYCHKHMADIKARWPNQQKAFE